MLVRVSDNQQVNTDHVVNIAQPNANQPDQFTVSLSNARQVTTDRAGVDRIEVAMGGPPTTGTAMPVSDGDPNDEVGV